MPAYIQNKILNLQIWKLALTLTISDPHGAVLTLTESWGKELFCNLALIRTSNPNWSTSINFVHVNDSLSRLLWGHCWHSLAQPYRSTYSCIIKKIYKINSAAANNTVCVKCSGFRPMVKCKVDVRVKCREILWRLKMHVDRLGSGPHLLGQLGSRVQISVSFQISLFSHLHLEHPQIRTSILCTRPKL